MKYKQYKTYILSILLLGVVATFGAIFIIPKVIVKEVKPTQEVHLVSGDTYTLTASKVTKIIAGKKQSMLAYNGSIPGPTIIVDQGSEVTIKFINNTDEPQLLHSHGVRMDNQYDGSQTVQKEVKPHESFSYILRFPDAGIYWYHPHAGEVKGQALGLYGAFVVKPTKETYFPKVNSEHVIFLADIPVRNGIVSIDPNSSALMGHYGNVMLTNGEEHYRLLAKQGEVKRLYIINAANVRPFNFTIPGAQMKLVGGDSGSYEKASFVTSILLAPSERAIVDVYFKDSGTFAFENKTPAITYPLGSVLVSKDTVETSYLQQFKELQINKDTITSINPMRTYFTKPADKRLKFTIDMEGMMGNGTMMGGGMMRGGMMSSTQNNNDETIVLMGMRMNKEQAVEHCKSMPDMAGCEDILHPSTKEQVANKIHNDGIEWDDTMPMMSQMMTIDTTKWKIQDEDTGKENMDIMWDLTKDKPVIIDVENDGTSMHPMQHPLHFHGQRFLVVSRNGIPEKNLVWKDTALIRIGEKVRLVLDPSNKGEWMAHCHISEHLASGMMFGFMVR